MAHPPIQPEGPQSEWKVQLPKAHRTARTLCAFANGAGGSLWVGVRDDGSLAGVGDVPGVRGQLQEALDLVEPRPRVHVERVCRDGLVLVHARVKPNRGVVHRVWAGEGAGAVFLRAGSSTFEADRQAVKALENRPSLRLDAKQRSLLELLHGRGPTSIKDMAAKLRMGERSARRLLVPLLQAGLAHARDGRRFALTALGQAQLGRPGEAGCNAG